jgi:lysophospholipase L1-like esterase
VGRIAEAGLRRKDPRTGDHVATYNCGVGGDRVSNVLDRFEQEAHARNPAAIVIAIGINDARHDEYPGTSNDEFTRVYGELIDMALTRAEDVMAMTPTNVDENRPEHDYRNGDIAVLASAVKACAASRRVKVVDVFGSMSPADLSPDGLHPGGEGHQKLFDVIAPAVFALPSLNP